MKVTCPFCGITGEIADQSNPKPLRCRQCGSRFQPTNPAADDPAEQVIDVDHLVLHTPPDLGGSRISYRIQRFLTFGIIR